MEASLILKNLEKLDKIHQFVSLIETNFADNEAVKLKIGLAKDLLDNSLSHMTFSIDKNLKEKISNFPQVSHHISDALNILNNDFFTSRIKNFHLFINDLEDTIKFIQNCELQPNFSLIEESDDEIIKLKEKILIIISERNG